MVSYSSLSGSTESLAGSAPALRGERLPQTANPAPQ